MGTVTLRNLAAPDGTYLNKTTVLTHGEVDTNFTLFLRNDSNDSSAGTISAVSFSATSDIRFKKDLEKITDALAKTLQLTGYTYTMIDSDRRMTGLVAQDIEKVLPEVIVTNNDKLYVEYGNMLGLIVEAIKELNAKIDNLSPK